MYCYHHVVAVVEAASVHVTHEVNERVVIAKKHVDCNDQRWESYIEVVTCYGYKLLNGKGNLLRFFVTFFENYNSFKLQVTLRSNFVTCTELLPNTANDIQAFFTSTLSSSYAGTVPSCMCLRTTMKVNEKVGKSTNAIPKTPRTGDYMYVGDNYAKFHHDSIPLSSLPLPKSVKMCSK